MDIGSAFTYVFDDEEWIKKVAIGGGLIFGGLILTPILIGLALFVIVTGYSFETLKNVRDGVVRPLPEWTDFGGLFSKGLLVVVIALIYNVPSLILSCASAGINVASQQLDPDVAATLAFGAACASCLQVLVSLLGNALLPAAIIRYAQFESLGAAFQFGEIFSFIRENIGDYIIAVLLSWVAGFVATLGGLILCVIGIFFTTFWSYLVGFNLYGQLARKMTV
ncbi:MAG: DUF4013 domain-containing protein [Anaerolineae bacterium]|nr:DUF4013 domain-containing protein [Anaerolineae bacterium]